jgi:hypothetical protein
VHHVLLESSMMMVMRALHAWTARLGTFLLVHLLCARSVQRASTTMMATLRPHVTSLTPRVQQVTMPGRVRSAVTSARLDVLTWMATPPLRALLVLRGLYR